MKLRYSFFGTAIVLFLALFCTACKQQITDHSAQVMQATTHASSLLASIDASRNGADAVAYRDQLLETLNSVGASTATIGVTNEVLNQKVRDAWFREGCEEILQLKKLSTDPYTGSPEELTARAVELRKQFISAQRNSGRNMEAFNVSGKTVNHYVARAYLIAAQKNGGNPTPADFKAAGMPVPKEMVVRYRNSPRRHHRHHTVASLRR